MYIGRPRPLGGEALAGATGCAAGAGAAAGAGWYTKRGALAAVYVAAELHLLADGSPGCGDTWAFLDRRLADAEAAGRAVGGLVEGVVGRVGGVGGL